MVRSNLLISPTPGNVTHAVLFNALERHEKKLGFFYIDRINTLAHMIAHKGVLSAIKRDVDMSRFLSLTGFTWPRHDTADMPALERSINRHLLTMELDYPKCIRYERMTDGTFGDLTLIPGAFNPRPNKRARQRISDLVRDGGVQYSQDPGRDLLEHVSWIVSKQKPEEFMIPMLRRVLEFLAEAPRGVPLNAVQLKMLATGMDADPIGVSERDRYILNVEVTLNTTDGRKTARAAVGSLIEIINRFIADTPPAARGVIPGDATYQGPLGYFAWALEHPVAVKTMAATAMRLFGPVLFGGDHGTLVAREMPRIIAALMADGNLGYLRALVKNRRPLHLKPQYLEDVTGPQHGNAWQRTVRLSSGEEVTYAEILLALRALFSAEANMIYRHQSWELLATMGIAPLVHDPHRSLEKLPSEPFYVFSNHESYIDILVIAGILRNVCHSFAARDNLVTYTGAISPYLFAALHTNMQRRHKGMSDEEWNRIREKTIADYQAAVLKHGATLVLFPQGTRSRTGRYLKENYAQHGMTALTLALQNKRPVLPIHLVNTGNAFMYTTRRIGEVLGLRKIPSLEGYMKVWNTEMPVFGSSYAASVEAYVGPLLEVTDPDATMQKLLAFHDDVEAHNAAVHQLPRR